jgi:hypothetical protein
MGKYCRSAGGVENVERRAVAGVAAALDYADTIHLGNHSSAERGKSMIVGVMHALADCCS